MRIALIALLALGGCGVGHYLSDFDEVLSGADRLTIAQCADLDMPGNAARIDALALMHSATNKIEETHARREAFCELKRA